MVAGLVLKVKEMVRGAKDLLCTIWIFFTTFFSPTGIFQLALNRSGVVSQPSTT